MVARVAVVVSLIAGVMRPAAASEPVRVEGPVSDGAVNVEPRVDQGLEARRRKICRATIGLGGVAVGTLIVAGGLLGGYNRTGDDRLAIADGFAWTTFGAATIAMIGTGIGCGLMTWERRRLLAGESLWPVGDPRRDTKWRIRDRNLKAGTVAFGTLAGIGVLGLVVTFALSQTSGNDEDGTPAGISYVTFASVTGLSALPAIGYGVAWHHHRTPLRKFRLSPTAGGLVLRF
jgi:hypothetical protein